MGFSPFACYLGDLLFISYSSFVELVDGWILESGRWADFLIRFTWSRSGRSNWVLVHSPTYVRYILLRP